LQLRRADRPSGTFCSFGIPGRLIQSSNDAVARADPERRGATTQEPAFTKT
jgi:hypothetical protein